ncbi:exocyst complex component SEC8 [Amaranthus tricolor]|uniref:exocyst complex component SEC8 n=1 Tax=Amaranthus tricolor TaxID=29722 RepID=UPI00258CDB39|nr:exocyst complex component SEC8 [Amaranthus tricolor]
MGLFDGLPFPSDKADLREELSRIDESWAAARFDSLPHVVRLLTAKEELQVLKEQSEIVEDVVNEVVHAYHSGFNRAIQNYSQILRLFSESAESISVIKVDLAEAKKRLGARNKQLHQFWYRSVTLRHIISLLDQIEGLSKVPARMEKLINEKQFYAAVQLHVQSTLMLEREGLQTVGALQDVKSELTKLRGILFYKVVEDLHAHLYNKGDYSSISSNLIEKDDGLTMTATLSLSMSISQPVSRRTRSSVQVDGSSYDGHVEDGGRGEEADGSVRANGGDYGLKNSGIFSTRLPPWLSSATPDEFLEAVQKNDAPLHVKYLQTMVECLCKLGKVAAAGAIICQRLRPTIHEIISSEIKSHAETKSSFRPGSGLSAYSSTLQTLKGHLETYQLSKQKRANGVSLSGTLLAVSPVTPVMAPMGTAQAAARELLDSVLDVIIKIFENHVFVGELLEAKANQHVDINTPKSVADVTSNTESAVTGGYSIGFSLTVLQSECQQLICEILRATPEATSADAAVQTARLAGKVPSKEKRDGSEDGLTFAFRFSDATMSLPNQVQVWNKKAQSTSQEGYGSASVLPEEGIYLAAAVYRPVLQFTEKVISMLPAKFFQSGSDGLLAFVENFVKDHFLPTMFVDYRKSVQQAISSPAAFRPRAHAAASYTPSVEKGRPILQGLLAIDLLMKEVLGWAQAMPKFAAELVKYVQTFLERAYERCRTSYMEAVLEKQSYMLIGRNDIESLMKLDPSSSCLQNCLNDNPSDAYGIEVEKQMSDLLLGLRPIKQENLIRDDNKLILLASLSDSLEYVADSIERLGKTFSIACNQVEEKGRNQRTPRRSEVTSSPSKDLASFADDYRKLAIDCLKVLRVEMQLETVFHMQEMTTREYMDDLDAEEPDDFIISLAAQITRRDEAIAPFVSGIKQHYIFGGICGVAANTSIKTLANMRSLNLFGVQQICRNSIALEQALAAIPSLDSEAVQLRLDRVRTYFELLNMPFEALLAFITEHEDLFTPEEYTNLLKVQVPGREIPSDALERVSEILR